MHISVQQHTVEVLPLEQRSQLLGVHFAGGEHEHLAEGQKGNHAGRQPVESLLSAPKDLHVLRHIWKETTIHVSYPSSGTPCFEFENHTPSPKKHERTTKNGAWWKLNANLFASGADAVTTRPTRV